MLDYSSLSPYFLHTRCNNHLMLLLLVQKFGFRILIQREDFCFCLNFGPLLLKSSRKLFSPNSGDSEIMLHSVRRWGLVERYPARCRGISVDGHPASLRDGSFTKRIFSLNYGGLSFSSYAYGLLYSGFCLCPFMNIRP